MSGANRVAEKKFVFYTPISIYNLLILGSRSALFHNYRIWPWAYPGPWISMGWAGFFGWPMKAQARGPLVHKGEGSFGNDCIRPDYCSTSQSQYLLSVRSVNFIGFSLNMLSEKALPYKYCKKASNNANTGRFRTPQIVSAGA